MSRRERECARCHRTRPTYARGLCRSCYATECVNGRLGQWDSPPPINWRAADLLGEWGFLSEQGYTRQQAAERLGVKPDTLYQAIRRARKAS